MSRQQETVALLVNEGFNVSEALKYLKINQSTCYYKPKGTTEERMMKKYSKK